MPTLYYAPLFPGLVATGEQALGSCPASINNFFT